jgi:hypothetical protein
LTELAVGEFEAVWEAAGSRVADALDGAHAVVVLGHDPIATAAVALGLARAQAKHRRVAVGDLIGDVAPLRELVTDDDPHGLTDSFLYGVSLNRIARQIDTIGNLHVLPSGSDQVVQDEILRNKRWTRLASGFRDAGALLLVAAPAAVPGVEDLVGMLDGVVLVGGVANPVPNAPVLAEVSSAARRTAPRRGAGQPTPTAPVVPYRRRWVIPVAAAAAIVAIATLLGRNIFGRAETDASSLRRDSAAASSDSLVSSGSVTIDSSPPLTIANPADSAGASAYAVQVAMVDTEDGAALRVRTGGGDFPAGTYAPVSRGADRGTWYKVTTGAYVNRSNAEQLLGFLRTRGLLPRGWGSVVRTPLALRVATAPSVTEAAALIADYQSRGVPVYALQQQGGVTVYVGAFQSPEEASLYRATLKSTKNIDATLVYRVGRAY